MSLSGKVFMLVFVMIAAVLFVGMLSYLSVHSTSSDVTINSTENTYFDSNSEVNQSINKSLQYGQVAAEGGSAWPLLLALFVTFSGLFLFLLVVKRR